MFKFELGQSVTVSISGEKGKVKGRAEFENSKNTYYLHLKRSDGRAVDVWFDGADLEAVVVQTES